MSAKAIRFVNEVIDRLQDSQRACRFEPENFSTAARVLAVYAVDVLEHRHKREKELIRANALEALESLRSLAASLDLQSEAFDTARSAIAKAALPKK